MTPNKCPPPLKLCLHSYTRFCEHKILKHHGIVLSGYLMSAYIFHFAINLQNLLYSKISNLTSPQYKLSLPITSVFILFSGSILPFRGAKAPRSSILSWGAHIPFDHTQKYTLNTSQVSNNKKEIHVTVNSSRRRGCTSKNATKVRSDLGCCLEGKSSTAPAWRMGVGIPRADQTRSESIHFWRKGLLGSMGEENH